MLQRHKAVMLREAIKMRAGNNHHQCTAALAHLESSTNNTSYAWMIASEKHTGPTPSTTYATMLRQRHNIGIPFPSAQCPCGKAQASSDHALVCHTSPIYAPRHTAGVHALTELLRATGHHPYLEVPLSNYGAGPDQRRLDVVYSDDSNGITVGVDFTVAACNRKQTAGAAGALDEEVQAGKMATQAEVGKAKKYGDVQAKYGIKVQPVAFDSAGCPGEKTAAYLNALYRAATTTADLDLDDPDTRLFDAESEHCPTDYWRKRLSFAILRSQASQLLWTRASIARGGSLAHTHSLSAGH